MAGGFIKPPVLFTDIEKVHDQMELHQRLPQVLCERWSLKTYHPLTRTASAALFRAVCSSGESVVIKQSFQSMQEIEQAISYLQWQNGIACVRLLGRFENYLLLEDAGDIMLTESINGADDRFSLEVAACVVAEMQQNMTPFTGELPTLNTLFKPLEKALDANAFQADDESLTALYHNGVYMVSKEHVDDAFRPLHGDIHFDNIMHAKRGWIAIDPHGYFGHRAFDYANLFYNPLGKIEITDNPDRIRYAGALFAKVAGLPLECILRYAFLYGCLSAFWYRDDEDQKMEQATLRTAHLVFNEWLKCR